MKSNRQETIDKLIRQVWLSLDSHLDLTHKKSPEGPKFHQACCKEYAEIIRDLTNLY